MISDLEIRIRGLSEYFECIVGEKSRAKVDRRILAQHEISELKATAGVPSDLVKLLSVIGEVEWSNNNCQVISWWSPCSIESIQTRDRLWWYEFSNKTLKNGDKLLTVACDVDATIYLYDTTKTPWVLCHLDGLSCNDAFRAGLSDIEAEVSKTDLISILENLAKYYKCRDDFS